MAKPTAPSFRPIVSSKAFSLIELLLAVTIVVILYVLYLTGGSQNMRAKQKRACEKNLQNAYVALKTYSLAHKDQFPVMSDAVTSEEPLGLLIPRSTTMTQFFICPGSKDKVPPQAKPFGKHRISYAYYMGLNPTLAPNLPLMTDEQINVQAKKAGQPLFSSTGKGSGSNHDRFGGVILFCDGNTQVVNSNAPVPMPIPQGVTLLNPKP